MRAGGRDALKKIGDGGEARVAGALVVERAVAHEVELRPVEGVAVDLPVIELDRADGLVGREATQALGAQAAVAAVLFVLVEPRRDR